MNILHGVSLLKKVLTTCTSDGSRITVKAESHFGKERKEITTFSKRTPHLT